MTNTKKTPNNKQTVEQLLARADGKIDKAEAEWTRKDAYATLMASYAQTAKDELERAEEKRDRMAEVIEDSQHIFDERDLLVEELERIGYLSKEKKAMNADYLILEGKVQQAEKAVEEVRNHVAQIFYGFA